MENTFDFIVVGGGTAGCLVAAELAAAQTRPSVLLVEAGGETLGDSLRSTYDRFTPAFTRSDLDHGYMTSGQVHLNDRVIRYERGKGLGGSSMINFMSKAARYNEFAYDSFPDIDIVYLYGSAEDYDHWADLVGDESWKWESTKKRLYQIETFHSDHVNWDAKYASSKRDAHGHNGRIDVSLPTTLEKGIDLILDAGVEFGYSPNADMNSGNPMGIGIFPASSQPNGLRTTSASAYLVDKHANLVIWTDSPVARVLLEGKKTVGIELIGGRRGIATKEVILCAGTFDTPKVLLLSGIGPTEELAVHGIDTVHHLPGLGKNLQDHPAALITAEVDPVLSEKHAFECDTNNMLHARAQWAKDRSGPLRHHNSAEVGVFLKLPRLEDSEELGSLDLSMQVYLSKPTVPHFEFVGSAPNFAPGFVLPADSAYFSYVALLMNAQSRGEVTLRSSDPRDAPVVNPNYLDHPYDRKAMLEGIRETMRFQQESAIGKHFKRYLCGPKSTSDKDILDFMRENTSPCWHANGTVKMGKANDVNACVDQNFRVYGMDSLRVADLSICPSTINNHSQSTAYLIGHKAAETIIRDWKL